MQTEFDGLGRPKSVCQIQVSGGSSCGQANTKNGISTTFAYTTLAGSTQVTATRGIQTHTGKYDALGRLTYWNSPERGTITYTYDTQSSTCGGHAFNGHLVEAVDNAQNHICYSYDTTLGRLVQISSAPSSTCVYYAYGDNAPAPPTGVTFLNGNGRLVAAYTSATCSGRTALTTDEWFSYDAEGHITDMWQLTPHSGGYYHTTAAYLIDGTLQSLSGIPGYTAIAYVPDTVGRPITAKEGSTNIVSGVSYNSASQPLTISIGNSGGDSSNYVYDSNTGRMTNWTFTVGSVPKSQTGTLNWNPNGTLGSLIINDGFNPGGSQNCYFGKTATQTPGYDDLGRLISADCSPVWSQAFSYDQYDNITKTGSSSWACSTCYNQSNNQYNTSISPSIAYDANGRLTNDTFQKYQWNAYGQLSGTIAATGGNITCGSTGYCYTYDAFGQMVELSKGSSYFEMLYSALGKTAQMNGQVAVYSYFPLPGGGTLYSSGSSGTNRFYQHKDWLGSVRVESAIGGRTVTYDRAFAPYGEWYDNFGASGQLNFTGDTQDFNATAAFFDTPNRELHVTQGRWISPDLVDGGWNAYAYTTDPNLYTDRSGLQSGPVPPYKGCWICRLFGGLFGSHSTNSQTLTSPDSVQPPQEVMDALDNSLHFSNPDWGPHLSIQHAFSRIQQDFNHTKFAGHAGGIRPAFNAGPEGTTQNHDIPANLQLVPVADSGSDEQPFRMIAYALETKEGTEPNDHWYITEHQTAEGLAPNHESTGHVPNFFIDAVGTRDSSFQSTQTFFISKTFGNKDVQVNVHTPKGDYKEIGIWSKTTPGGLFNFHLRGQVFENGFLSWPGAKHWSFPYPGLYPPGHDYMIDLMKVLSQ